MISFLSKRRGATLAGIFSLALSGVVLLCGAGSAPIENLLPQGAMQGDLNAGGHNLTNAATVYATNVVVSGSLTAPTSFSLPYAQITGAPTLATVATSGAYNDLTGKPTLGTLSPVSPGGTASSTTFLKFDGTTFSYATPPGTTTSGTALLYGNGSGGFSNATIGGGLAFSGGTLSASVTSVAGRSGAIVLTAADISGLATVATSGSYTDLSSKPTIPAAQVNSDWNATSGVAQILNKPTLAASATTDTTSASNITSGTLAAARVATLNQNTTGSAGSFTGSLAGDVTGTQGATTVGKINGTSLAGLGTGLLKNTTGTGVPSIATAGTDYPGLSTANVFTGNQTLPNYLVPTGPSGINVIVIGDSRISSANGSQVTANVASMNPWGYLDRLVFDLQNSGFCYNARVASLGEAGASVENAALFYGANSFTTTGNITSGSNSVAVTGSTSGISGFFGVGGPGIPPGTYGAISGSTITLHNQYPQGLTPTASTTGATLDINLDSQLTGWSYQTAHENSPAVTGYTNSIFVIESGVNDYIPTNVLSTFTNGSATFNITPGAVTWIPVPGYTITGTGIPGGTTISSCSINAATNVVTVTMSAAFTGTTGSVTATVTPAASAWETVYTGLVNAALADNYKVVCLTIPKATISGYATYDSTRQTFNAWILSQYGSTSLGNDAYSGSTSNVYVIDSATASTNYFPQSSALVSADGLHFTAQGSGLWAAEVNSALETVFSSQMSGVPLPPNMPWLMPACWLGQVNNLTVGSSSQGGSFYINGGSGNPQMHLGSATLTGFGNQAVYLGGAQIATVPTTIAGTVPVIPSGAPTSVAGSTSGTAAFSEPFNETYYKKVVIYCNALTGTASYTFPTAFANTPVVVSTSGPAASVVTTLSATALTVTGSGTTGSIVVEGY